MTEREDVSGKSTEMAEHCPVSLLFALLFSHFVFFLLSGGSRHRNLPTVRYGLSIHVHNPELMLKSLSKKFLPRAHQIQV